MPESAVTLTFFKRAFIQLPTLILSAGTIVLVARNLGPTGRGEISAALLITSIFSQILTIPIFIALMHLNDKLDTSNFVSRSLFYFSKVNSILILIFNVSLLAINQYQGWVTLPTLILLNLLVFSYFVTTQIRDYFLKLQYNYVYAIDFIIQLLIAIPIFILVTTQELTVFRTLTVFTNAYLFLSITLLTKFKLMHPSFKLRSIIWKVNPGANVVAEKDFKGLFAVSGFIVYVALNKDAFLAFLVLERSEFGLMSAVASFWIALRFLRPMTVLQTKLERKSKALEKSNDFNIQDSKNLPNLRRQMFAILAVGVSAYFLTPLLMGSGFQPSLGMTVAGFLSEMLLMAVIYEISMKPTKSKIHSFNFACLVQGIVIVSLGLMTESISITVIWVISIVSNAIWFLLVYFRDKKLNV